MVSFPSRFVWGALGFNRESGESPGQSRCCNLYYRLSMRSHWYRRHLDDTGKVLTCKRKSEDLPLRQLLHTSARGLGWMGAKNNITIYPSAAMSSNMEAGRHTCSVRVYIPPHTSMSPLQAVCNAGRLLRVTIPHGHCPVRRGGGSISRLLIKIIITRDKQ